jgi:hypothetical protein
VLGVLVLHLGSSPKKDAAARLSPNTSACSAKRRLTELVYERTMVRSSSANSSS